MKEFLALLRRDLRLAFRQGGDGTIAVSFFILAAILFPFGVGPDPSILARIAAGIIWVIALLAGLLTSDGLFRADWEDGTLDLLALSPCPLELIVLAKCLVHWLLAGLPVLIAVPLVGTLLGLAPPHLPMLLAAMALGTPTLSLIGAVGAALVLGARQGGVLLSLLILPLEIPVLIFGVAAVDAALAGRSSVPELLVLGAMFAAALPLCPLAAAAALRQALE